MAINLEKYKESILSAWKEVVDDKVATNWALFSYEGQTNDLKVVSKGDGGIEELRDDLNSGKIMYAFCRVLDPKTSLHKFVLINWTGEGAPNLRKGTCANHIREVCNMLKGAHVTISARNEEEVDSELIIEKVSKATGSAYSFKERGETVKASGPVGTTYKRVIPQQEIDAKERDKFWQKEEEEEKKRQEEEKRHKDEERKKLENEREQRELKEAATREARIQERSNSITLQRAAERLEEKNVGEGILNRPTETEGDREKEERERKNRSEQLRRQRSQEAQALISKRTIDARAVFEQNTSAGQLYQKKSSYQPSSTSNPSEKVRWPPQIVTTDSIHPEPVHNNVSQIEPQSLSYVEPKSPVSFDNITENNIEEAVKSSKEEEIVESIANDSLHSYTERPINGGTILEPEENLGLRAQALYDYQAADDTEISFDPGDIITHIDQIDAGWWQGLDTQGNFGLFPANYVQLLD